MNSLRQKITLSLVVMLLLAVVARAEPQERRWLFVFGTSSAMKKRLPAVDAEIKTLLTGTNALLGKGDSLGIWTFDEQLHLGQFPLTTWDPDRSSLLASNLTAFVRKQKYTGTASLDALQPTLNRIIEDSERLTVVIFYDGAEQIHWTPYDQGINDAVKRVAAEQKKSLQPVVLLLRTQTGKYVGATVNLPPVAVNAPPFPLLAREQKPVVTNPPVVAPVVPKTLAPPLIIVGTHVSTNANDLTNRAAISTTTAVTNLAPTNTSSVILYGIPSDNGAPITPAVRTEKKPIRPKTPEVNTNDSAPPPTIDSTKLNPAPRTPLAPTNNIVVASVAPPGDGLAKLLTYSGGALLLAAVGLVIFLLRPRRVPMNSLITSSMQENFQIPKQK
jgi:hypothetical protein